MKKTVFCILAIVVLLSITGIRFFFKQRAVKTWQKRLCEDGVVQLPGNVELEFIHVKAGSFLMGSPEDEIEREENETQHHVTLTQDYWLGKFEVTQEQWKVFVNENPAKFKGEHRPVENVSWNDAQEFCKILNECYKDMLPEGYSFGLPTEAQWEYACRAGTTTAFSFGDICNDTLCNCSGYYPEDTKRMDSSPELIKKSEPQKPYGFAGCADLRNKPLRPVPKSTQAQNTPKNSEKKTRGTCDVGSYAPNAWGFYDMHGNVEEWCSDEWDEDYYTSLDKIDPRGPIGKMRHVIRGGSWDGYCGWYCRSAYHSSLWIRVGEEEVTQYGSLGFRIAIVPVN